MDMSSSHLEECGAVKEQQGWDEISAFSCLASRLFPTVLAYFSAYNMYRIKLMSKIKHFFSNNVTKTILKLTIEVLRGIRLSPCQLDHAFEFSTAVKLIGMQKVCDLVTKELRNHFAGKYFRKEKL